jgi:hypothetical protein
VEQALQRRLEIGFALLVLAALVVFVGIGFSYPARPRELPLLVGGIGIVLVLKHLIAVIRRPAIPGQSAGAEWNWKAVFLAFGSMATYLAATLVFGMVLSSAVIVYGCGLAFGAKSRAKLALITAMTVAGIYLLFVVALRVPLYQGLLGNLLNDLLL